VSRFRSIVRRLLGYVVIAAAVFLAVMFANVSLVTADDTIMVGEYAGVSGHIVVTGTYDVTS